MYKLQNRILKYLSSLCKCHVLLEERIYIDFFLTALEMLKKDVFFFRKRPEIVPDARRSLRNLIRKTNPSCDGRCPEPCRALVLHFRTSTTLHLSHIFQYGRPTT